MNSHTQVLQVRALALPGVFEITPVRHGDDRGWFCETYNAADLAKFGIDMVFVQDNHSWSRTRGVLRGLHYQLPEAAQDKLVRVTRGSVFDIAVDIRKASPAFGKYTGLELSAERGNQILVPKGFAHGFVTLEPDTEVIYKVSAPYAREHEKAIRFDDPDIGIEWPVESDQLMLSPKDRAAPLLREQETGF